MKSRYKIVDGDASQKIETTLPAIIPLELYEAAQALNAAMVSDNPRNNKNPNAYLLRNGFVYCGCCGYSMHGTMGGPNQDYRVYRCSPRKYGKTPCKGKNISSPLLDNAVWAYVGEIIEDYNLIEKALQHWKEKADFQHDFRAIQKSIEEVEDQQDQLMQDLRRKDESGKLYLQGRMRDLALKDAQELEESLQRLRAMLVDTSKSKQAIQAIISDFEAFVNRCLTIREAYETADYKEKRNLLRFLGIKVRVYREDDPDHERYEIDVMPEIFKGSSSCCILP